MSKSLLVMETPKSCRGCNFASMEDWGNEYCDVQDGNVVIDKYNETRHPQCPLKQLPSEEEVLDNIDDLDTLFTIEWRRLKDYVQFMQIKNVINTIYGDRKG